MLYIYTGRSGTGKTEAISREIAVNASRGRERQILLVPDQYSHMSERELCLYCGDHISMYCEVQTFENLARRILSVHGGLAVRRLDEGGRILFMKQAVDTAAGRLRVFAKASRQPTLLHQLLRIADEFKHYLVDEETLLSLAGRIGDTTLGQKLSDFGLIFTAYNGLLGEEFADSADLLTQAARGLRESNFLRGRDVFIDGFDSFTSQEFELIRLTLCQANSVTAAFTCDTEDRGFFQSQLRWADRLKREAESQGIEIRQKHFMTNRRIRHPALAHLEKNLFDYAAPAYEEECKVITLYSASGRMDECEYAASQIRKLVSDDGYRYRDIAVVARSLDEYIRIIRPIFKKYDVPVFLDRRDDILNKPPVMLVLYALYAVMRDFRCEDVLRYLKTGYTGLSQEECDCLENYCAVWPKNGSQWYNGEDWDGNPRGYTDDTTERDAAVLSEVNRIRKKAAAPLASLRKEALGEKTADKTAASLYRFLERIGLPGRLEKLVEKLRASDERRLAAEYIQIWEILCGVLDQIVMILKDSPTQLREFAEILRLVLSQYNVGVIPTSLDSVTVGDADRIMAGNIRCVLVLGVNNGAFPLTAQPEGLLTEEERQLLGSKLRVELAPSGEDRLNIEQNILYQTLAMPSEKLFILWPSCKTDGTALEPSYIVDRIAALFPGAQRSGEDQFNSAYKTWAAGPCIELAVRPEPADGIGAAAREAVGRIPELSEYYERVMHGIKGTRGPLEKEGTIRALYGDTLTVSASQIERYYNCRYQYFLQFGLRLKPRKKASYEAPEIGTFLHYVLEYTAKAVREQGGWKKTPRENVFAAAHTAVSDYIKTFLQDMKNKTPRFRYLFSRLKRQVDLLVGNLCDELAVSDFAPLYFEYRFGGEEKSVRYEPEDGLPVSLSGVIDRVDTYERDGTVYVRIVDYKSSVKVLKYHDILHGLNIQMLLYLFALCGEGREMPDAVPAGVLYMPANTRLISAARSAPEEEILKQQQKNMRRSGLVIEDAGILRAMENTLSGDGRFIPVKLDEDGNITAKNAVVSAAQFGRLRSVTEKLLCDMARELRYGRNEAKPKISKYNPCEFCDYRAVCQFDPAGGDGAEILRPISKEDFYNLTEGAES